MLSLDTWDGGCVHEYRFLVAPQRVAEFIRATAPHVEREVYDLQRPIAYTRTTYLDTDTGSYARSAERGAAERLRIREYASATNDDLPVLTGQCFLEYKRTSGNRRLKMRLRGAPEHIAALVGSHGEVTAPFGMSATALHLGRRLASPHVRPRVATWYRRESFFVPSKPVRITLDHEVTFLPPSRIGRLGEVVVTSRRLGGLEQCVLEVKLAGQPQPWLVSAMMGLEESRTVSKFARAMAVVARST